MNILFLSTEFATPGRPTEGLSHYDLVRALSQGHRVRVVAPVPWPGRPRPDPAGGGNPAGASSPSLPDIEVHHPRYNPALGVLGRHRAWFYWRSVRDTLLALAARDIPDCILSSPSQPDGAAAARLGRTLGVPAAVLVGGSDERSLAPGARQRDAAAKALRAVDIVFAENQGLRDTLVGLGLPADKVVLWQPGGDGSTAPPQAEGGGWHESVEQLLGHLGPLVRSSQDPVWPWWARHPADKAPPRAGAPGVRGRFTRLLRRAGAELVPRRLLFRRGPRARRSVCLTFDDGPHPEHTPQLLDALKRAGARATFFVVGRLVERYPDVLRRMAAEGHLIENHSFYHTKLAYLTAGELIAGLRRTRDLIFRLTGHVSTLYRPPYGAVTAWQALRIWQAGQRIVLWNKDPKDFQAQSPAEISAWFTRNPLQGGDVVLMHDRLPGLAGVVLPLIEEVRKAGLGFTTLDEWTRGAAPGAPAIGP
jgi:peptidoglycan/xylan/chitin deacetylase (PgdA/CDA1 family)